MATYIWQGTSGNFTDPSRWSGGTDGTIPSNGDVIDIGNYDDSPWSYDALTSTGTPPVSRDTGQTVTLPPGTLPVSTLNIGDTTLNAPGFVQLPTGAMITEIGVNTTISGSNVFENDGTIKLLPHHAENPSTGDILETGNTIAGGFSSIGTFINNGTVEGSSRWFR